jgi:hypothetical protein
MIAATMQIKPSQMAVNRRTFVAQHASRSVVTPMIGARKLLGSYKMIFHQLVLTKS